jgi:hypothetical protein
MQPGRKPYQIGKTVLFAKQPEDLPVFFRKVGTLALWRKMSRAKARRLLREAVEAVASGVGMSYRLRPNQSACLTLTAPTGIDRWVADQARHIAKAMRKED